MESIYFVYRLKDGKTYGEPVFRTDSYEAAMNEAIAHHNATDEVYAVFMLQEAFRYP